MRFKIDWASLIVGSKFTVFALFYFVFENNFPSTSPRGVYIWRGDLTEDFLRYPYWRGLYMEGLIFGILRYSTKTFSDLQPPSWAGGILRDQNAAVPFSVEHRHDFLKILKFPDFITYRKESGCQ